VTLLARRTLTLVVVATAALAGTLLFAPGRAELAVHVYVLVVLALTLAAVVATIAKSVRGAPESEFDAALRRRASLTPRLAQLARLERETALARSNAFDLHFRLRPVLREVAGGLLAARRGVDLDREPARARAILGDEAWELVRAERVPPDDRSAPGIDTAALRRVVTALERL
jgi:hypothetical protein